MVVKLPIVTGNTRSRWRSTSFILPAVVASAALLRCAALLGGHAPTPTPKVRSAETHPRVELVSAMTPRTFLAKVGRQDGPVAVIVNGRVVRVSYDGLSDLPADVGVIADQNAAPADGSYVIVAERL